MSNKYLNNKFTTQIIFLQTNIFCDCEEYVHYIIIYVVYYNLILFLFYINFMQLVYIFINKHLALAALVYTQT